MILNGKKYGHTKGVIILTDIYITITKEQWEHIQELMLKHNKTQEEIVIFLMKAGMREMDLRKEWQ